MTMSLFKARRRSRIRLAFIFTSTVLVAVIITAVALTAPPLTGAIFTTDSSCGGTDLNIYASKDDVYLNGGPHNGSSAGLPDGEYYVQVTEPDGTLLGTSVGTNDETPVVVTGGVFDACYKLMAIVRTAGNPGPFPVAPNGFENTSNPGGEYKVWVSRVIDFANNETKTDNFKVANNPPPPARLNVIKYYDTDTDGTLDAGEVEITGWEVKVGAQSSFPITSEIKFTPVSIIVDPGCYTAQEGDATGWIHTTDKIDSKAVATGGTATISFGNVCLGPGGGLTLGFWSNKNGQAIMNATDLQHLRDDFKLRKADGTEFNPNTNAEVRSFLLGASATNMANMLSAQLIAMYLNVAHGNVNGGALLFAGSNPSGCSVPVNNAGFISVNTLIADAATELAASGLVLAGNPERACMEFKKNTLDKGNNNLNFVQPPGTCPVPTLFTYTDESAPACQP